jgi:type II restriction/modification system DNA methylase subunit YeeA
MDTNALKKFAQAARNLLIDQVRSKLDLVVDHASPARRQHPQAMKQLDAAIARVGKGQVIEQVAYTWFNRFTALRFMDANGYTAVGIVSPAEGQTRPEVLAEAMAGNLPEGAPASIAALLDGRAPSSDPQAEAYRQLLVHACNQWHGPMPFLFEQIDDFTELLMPEDLLSQTSILAELRKVMTEDACQDVEIIGWLYQFYISEKKDEVFAGLKKNQKITAENIPAATQLFTPHWIVRYLVENSLGRLWLLNRPDSKLAEQMDYYIAPEEPETDFLRIARVEDIRICDPAAGSGHMLTYAFDLLYAIYEEEGYEADKIPALILTHNLTGVEIDDRAGALAAFALAMKAAAKLGRRKFLRMEAKPDICVLQNMAFTHREVDDFMSEVDGGLLTVGLRETMTQFEQAKNFGSLIVPAVKDPAALIDLLEAQDLHDLLLVDVRTRVVAVLRMAEALSPKYHVVVANPPYMGGKGMNSKLQDFAKEYYPDSKSDLFAIFMERALALSLKRGMMAMINMQSWMFLSSFEKLRSKLLSKACLQSMAHLGPRAFDTIGGEVVSTTAFVFGNYYSAEQHGTYLRLVDGNNEAEKAELAEAAKHKPNSEIRHMASVAEITKLPGKPIAYWLTNEFRGVFDANRVVEDLAEKVTKGIFTGDNNRFLRFWFEISNGQVEWKPYDKAGESRRWFGSAMHVVDWRRNGAALKNFSGAGLGAMKFYEKPHFVWSGLSTGTPSYRFADAKVWFDDVSPSVIGAKNSDALLGYLNCSVATKVLMTLNPTLHYQIGDVKRIPVPDLKNEYAEMASACVALARSDWDAYETSWDFTTLPLLAPEHRAEKFSATYSRLRAHWQGMMDEMKRLEEDNNRIYIDAYGLQDELTHKVALKEITLTCNPAYSIKGDMKDDTREAKLRTRTMEEFLSYAVGCMFGRYSLDAPGLILANQGETLADYLARVPEPTFMPDEDNVIPVLDGNWFPDDITDRFRLFLRTTFGEAHFRENLKSIEDALGKDIRKYFTKDFYADHVKRYKKRPIYWMFSSPKGTFNALISMHRYRADTVSVILNDYLREFISKLEGERGRLEKLSDDPSASQGQRTKALKDVSVVVKQIDELNEWERDVVFPLAQAKIEIDLDDGVKANYPKFDTALKKIPGLEATDD